MDSDQVVFQRFEKDILPNKIVNSLLSLIKERQLQPGDKLPPERELASMMNVGRPSLRAALRALAIMNVVEIRPGSGTYVGSLEPDKLVERLDFVFFLDDSSIPQLFDARKTVELRTVALAAQHITNEEIDELEACLTRFRTLAAGEGTPVEELEQTDREFHKLVARAGRNPILHRFVSVVIQLAAESRRQTFHIPYAIEETIQDHRTIVDALKARDAETAQQAVLQHLERAERYLRQLIPDQPFMLERAPRPMEK